VPKVISRNWNPRFNGWVVIFKEDPMKYICLFNDEGKMTRAADSIVILGLEAEFQSAYDAYMEETSTSGSLGEEQSHKEHQGRATS